MDVESKVSDLYSSDYDSNKSTPKRSIQSSADQQNGQSQEASDRQSDQ